MEKQNVTSSHLSLFPRNIKAPCLVFFSPALNTLQEQTSNLTRFSFYSLFSCMPRSIRDLFHGSFHPTNQTSDTSGDQSNPSHQIGTAPDGIHQQLSKIQSFYFLLSCKDQRYLQKKHSFNPIIPFLYFLDFLKIICKQIFRLIIWKFV